MDTTVLSERATENVKAPDHWARLVQSLSNVWREDNEIGIVILGIAESTIMRREITEHIERNFAFDPLMHPSYGHGPRGSPRLRETLSTFMNIIFHPLQPVTAEEIILAAGLSGILDCLTWCLCNEGEGILVPRPLYTGFVNDIQTRSRGRVVPVSFAREDGTLDINDVLDAGANLRCFERAWRESEAAGVKIKAVLISNPHNPLGTCYSEATIRAIAKFCGSHGIHYISDEVYATSVFHNSRKKDASPFTSVLSLDLTDTLHSDRIHVMYGPSKDFGVNGFRLGMLYTRNQALKRAMLSITSFSWPAYLVQDVWARMLEDKVRLDSYLRENAYRLARSYDKVVAFFDAHDIPHFVGNAAIFIWVDLRKWLDTFEDEAEFAQECFKAGVMISVGRNFQCEEPGWVRLTFAVEDKSLGVGLGRLAAVVKAFQSRLKP